MVSFTLAGCGNIHVTGPDNSEKGNLAINIGSDMARSLVQPTLSMVISDYQVSLSGPGPDRSTTLQSSVTSRVITNLEPGTWTVKVDARNAEGTIIASDSTTAVVSAASTATANITVVPLAGKGSLSLDISWPADVLESPSVEASLIPGEGDSSSLSFTIDSDDSPNNASYEGQWDAGYYSLSLGLKDGDMYVWRRMLSVRMIEGESSAGSYVLTEADLSLVADPETEGAIEINIGSDLQNPFTLSFSGAQATMHRDQSMTVSVAISPAVEEASYRWYINSQLQEEITGSSISLQGTEYDGEGLSLQHGRYWLDLVVTAGGIQSSRTVFFDIPEYKLGDTGPAGGQVFYDKGMVSQGWRYLEAWTADEPGTYQWKTTATATEGTSEAIGSGYANTYTAMIGEEHPAAEAARNATHAGRGDWFLPSAVELTELWKRRTQLNISGTYYWSSTEGSNSSRAITRYGSNSTTDYSKTGNSTVRVIRRF